jgi:hypothetical protein
MSARSFLPIGDNPDRDQNAPRLKQARRGGNDLLPQPFEKIELRGHPACDAAADIQHLHGLTSLTSPGCSLARHYSGNCEWIRAGNGQIRERSGCQILGSSRLQTRQVPSMSTNQSQLAAAALETLHGARALPAAEATARLRDFVDSIGTILPPTDRLADASGALRTLLNQLESEGAATDDAWEHAIETMLSFANESA